MITYIEGKLVEKTPTKLIIDVNGVGFAVNIPLSTYERIGSVGDSIKISTYLYVREDVLELYGFASEEERELFLKLISVPGVGPKLAQGVLSGISIQEFKRSVLNDDYLALTSVSGIGRKTAQRLVVDLKDKLEAEPITTTREGTAKEAILALVSLGYKRSTAKNAVEKVLREERGSLSVEELIKKALRVT